MTRLSSTHALTAVARWCTAGLILATGLSLWAAPGSGEVTISKPPPADRLELPALARLETPEPAAGQGWTWRGEIPGGYAVARREFETSLTQQGWRLGRLVDLPAVRASAGGILVWGRGSDRLWLLLWETAPGRCGFSLRPETAAAAATNPGEKMAGNPLNTLANSAPR